MAETLLTFELQNFRRQFRYWYGCLSLLELSANSKLIKKIQDIENLMKEIENENKAE